MSASFTWLSIVDYSQEKEISISTIRRKIKKNELQWKKEKGRYLIWLSSDERLVEPPEVPGDMILLEENSELKEKVKLLEEQLSDSRMLINIYEKRMNESRKRREEASPAYH